MTNILETLVLSPPADLCFNCNEFTKESFSVDQFLQEHRNLANLETMRDDLGVYLKTLRSAMIELINKDYTDFVNLSSNLIGLDRAITTIQTPLGQLKEELLVVQRNIDDALNEVMAQLQRRRKIQERKRSLKSLNRVHYSVKKLNRLLNELNPDSEVAMKQLLMERAALEYNQLQFHAARCWADLSLPDKQNLDEIGSKLYRQLDEGFVACLKEDRESELLKVLSIYLALGKSSEAEQSYRRERVSPVMSRLINEEALAANPRGLTGLFDSLIAFVDLDMKTLRLASEATDKLGKKKGFDFVVNSYWPEVEQRLELNLSSIYAPGNPDHFYMCYKDMLQFLVKLEARCDRITLRQHPQYQSFMLRWNLPVYFQIRFQEIASSVEVALSSLEASSSPEGWRLVASSCVWQSLLRCWADKVFITQLTHRFWKLCLQILGRYWTWSDELITAKGAAVDTGTWVYLYTDVGTLAGRLDELFTLASHHLPPGVAPATKQQLHKCLTEWKEKLLSHRVRVSERLVSSVSANSISALRQVSEVPRLYRRTNRDAPVRSLPYVDAMLQPPLAFHTAHRDHPQLTPWLQSVFTQITKQYFVAVTDVLTSVQKTEESLRRLKKIRDRSTSTAAAPDRGGDDDKIRLQLYYDANYYCKKIEEVGVNRDDVEQLKDLLKLVETLHSKNGLK